ncbi:MAG: amidohydrolase family protein [Anaeromyxobacter sp.]
MTVRVVSAPWVLPGLAEGPSGLAAEPIADGAVVLEGDTVVAVGPRPLIEPRYGAGDRIDAVLLPALVNAHLHLEVSHLSGRVPGGSGLPSWIQLFVSARARAAAAEAPALACAMAVEDMVLHGVAAIGDVSNSLDPLPVLAAHGLAGTVFHEVFGLAPERLAAALSAADAALARHGPPPAGLRVVRTPHAIYSTPLDAIAALLDAGPGSIHLAEDPAERQLCADGSGDFARMFRALGVDLEAIRPRGRSAVALVAPHLRPQHLAVHCVDLDAEDVAALAASGATAVLCPRSNLHIGGRLPPLPQLLDAGVPLAVGTDSLASSPSLAPLSELAALHKAFPEVPSSRLMPLAWNGAAVGAPHVGRLAPGRAPGLLAAPLRGMLALQLSMLDVDPFEYLVLAHGAEERPFDWVARQRPGAEVVA